MFPEYTILNIYIIPIRYTTVKKQYDVRLKELKIKRGISQVKLAMDLNLSRNTISRYETNQREADYETLIKIADYFNVSLDYLPERDRFSGDRREAP